MPGRRSSICLVRKALLLLGAALLCGCAGLRLPRIDPTGERVLIWPPAQPRVAVPIATNPQAPPVLTDPFFPPQPAPGGSLSGGVLPAATLANLLPQDKLTITPDRILAPVGSDVVLKTGICTAEGFLLADQKIEWQLAREGVGQFVDLGGKGWLHPPLLPWNKGEKVDNYYAIGFTSNGPLCITRGNWDPIDDVEIRHGEGWASVNSPVEGTSHVTVRATSAVDDWAHRSATATIYWVDVQWTFPPTSIQSSGRPETITTQVVRQTDLTPIEGWIVRYQTSEASQLGPDASGQSVEVHTDPEGKASVEISPTDSGAPTTLIQIELVRPARFGTSDAPRLVIANGSTTIQWRGDAAPYVNPGQPNEPTPTPPLPGSWQGQPSEPPPLPNTPTNPAPTQTLLPRLEVEVLGDEEVEVGGEAHFELVIRNMGNAPATGLKVSDVYPEEFSIPIDPDRRLKIEKSLPSLAPQESQSVRLSFHVLAAGSGQLCHDVTVSSIELPPVHRRTCVQARSPALQKQPHLNVNIDGPVTAVANSSVPVLYTITVKNDGETPLLNTRIQAEFPRAHLNPQARTEAGGAAAIVTADASTVYMEWQEIPRLGVGESRRIDIDVYCLLPTLEVPAYVRATANAETGGQLVQVPINDDHVIQIQPATAPSTSAPAEGAPGGSVGSLEPTLRLGISVNADTLKLGATTDCQITVDNLVERSDEEVELRVEFPTGIIPNLERAEGPSGGMQVTKYEGGIIGFPLVPHLRPREVLIYHVPISAKGPGFYTIRAQVKSTNTSQLVDDSHQLEVVR